MSRFIETILVQNGRAKNLAYHQRRVARTVGRFFNTRPPELKKALLSLPESGTFRCRLIYAREIESVEFIPYVRAKKSKLLAIESDLNYNYKFKERNTLQTLLTEAEASGCDDALIIKNGLIADTTIANIAFFDGRRWITPAVPLLRGTARARLLESGVIVPGMIRPDELEGFSHFALMNALSGFYIGGPTENIVR